MAARVGNAFSLPFVNHLAFVSFFALQAVLVPSSFVFTPASWPILVIRIGLEIAQAWVTLEALGRASRSTFGFLRVLTIPLLLISDVFFLGANLTPVRYAGLAIIMATLLWLFRDNGKDRKGMFYVVASAVGAVLTLSLFKYDIQTYNSVVAEQLIVGLGMLIGLYFIERYKFGRNPFVLLKKRAVIVEALSLGLGAVLISYGYVYLAVSIATAMKRALGVLWSVLSGKRFFKEENLYSKLLACVVLLLGLILVSL